jgi:tetratricopeptide (TPR) repeat protein
MQICKYSKMLKLIFTLTYLIISFGNISSSYAAYEKKISIGVGEYLIAKVSHNQSDHKITKQYYKKIYRKDPDNLVALDRLMLLNLLDGDLRKANEYAIKLANVGCGPSTNTCCMNNQSPQGYIINAISFLNSYQFKYADQTLGNIWRGDLADSSFVKLLRAWVWASPGSIEKSMEIIDSITTNDFHSITVFHKALMYDLLDEIELAEIFYDQSLLMKNDMHIINLYINFLNRNNLIKKRNEVVKQYLEGFDKNFVDSIVRSNKRIINNAMQGMGVVFFDSYTLIDNLNDELTQAMLQLASVTSPNFHESNFILASYFGENKNNSRAIKSLMKIPQNHYLNEISTMQIAQYHSTDLDFSKSIDFLKKKIKRKVNYNNLLALGNYYRYEKNWDKAIDIYAQAIDYEINNNEKNLWEAYYKLGISYERNNNWNEAEKYFLKSLGLFENQPDVLNYLGYSYVDRNEKLDTAKEMIAKALSQKSNDPYILDSMAWYYYKVGLFEEALSLMEYASLLDPSDPTINEHYGDILWSVGREIEARFFWQKSIDMGPEESSVEQIQRKILTGI